MADDAGVARTTDFKSPRGLTEQCIALAHIPGADYKSKDADEESKFCAIDLYDPKTAMCPKFVSTSPGTYILSTEEANMDSKEFEATKCANAGHEKFKTLAKFKSTMNATGTSGTFALSSLLYFHFSRLLSADVGVPVAVYRTIDRQEHYERVSSKTAGKTAGLSSMMIAGWSVMRSVEQNPKLYNPPEALFTPDLKQIFGVMLKNKGKTRAGIEINGLRSAGWGDGQRQQFQQTPAFTALRSEKSLTDAIGDGQASAKKDPKMMAALGKADVSRVQMIYWMKQLSEISLLDYIFSQQDRVGNINYQWSWVYSKNGKTKSTTDKDNEAVVFAERASIPAPAELADAKPMLLQQLTIDDNDAGVMAQYANFAKRTQEDEKIRHYSPETYRRLMALDADLKSNGPISNWLSTALTLDVREIRNIKTNTAALAEIIRQNCKSGKLKLDLNPTAEIAGQASDASASCELK